MPAQVIVGGRSPICFERIDPPIEATDRLWNGSERKRTETCTLSTSLYSPTQRDQVWLIKQEHHGTRGHSSRRLVTPNTPNWRNIMQCSQPSLGVHYLCKFKLTRGVGDLNRKESETEHSSHMRHRCGADVQEVHGSCTGIFSRRTG